MASRLPYRALIGCAVVLLGLAVVLAAPPVVAQDAQALVRIEEALRAGDCRAAVEIAVSMSSSDRDPRTAVRTVELARACRHQPAALSASLRLRELDPENAEALRLVGTVALEAWQLDRAKRTFTELLAKPDVESERALTDILPALADGEAAPAAWIVFRDLVERDSASPRVLLELARLACASDDLSACRALIRDARERGGGRDARTLRLHVAALAAQGESQAALEEAALLAKGDPDNHRFVIAETLVSLERPDDARRELQRLGDAAESAGDDATVIEVDRRLAFLALSEGDLVEAERRFRRRLGAERGAAEAVYSLAVIADRRGESAVAEGGYRQLVEAGAGLAPRTRLARLWLARGETAQAMALFDNLLRSSRVDSIAIEIARTRALSDEGRHEAALEAIDLALSRHPEHPDLLYQKAVLLDAADRPREAIAAFEALLRRRPGDGHVENALGYTLADRSRQLPRAEKLIRSALAQRPDSAAILDSLAWVRFRRGDASTALPLLERAWRLSREPEIAAHWGEVLWALGQRERAREVWALGQRLAPDSLPLRRTMQRFLGTE